MNEQKIRILCYGGLRASAKINFRTIKDKANSIHEDKSNQEEKRPKLHWGKK